MCAEVLEASGIHIKGLVKDEIPASFDRLRMIAEMTTESRKKEQV